MILPIPQLTAHDVGSQSDALSASRRWLYGGGHRGRPCAISVQLEHQLPTPSFAFHGKTETALLWFVTKTAVAEPF